MGRRYRHANSEQKRCRIWLNRLSHASQMQLVPDVAWLGQDVAWLGQSAKRPGPEVPLSDKTRLQTHGEQPKGTSGGPPEQSPPIYTAVRRKT